MTTNMADEEPTQSTAPETIQEEAEPGDGGTTEAAQAEAAPAEQSEEPAEEPATEAPAAGEEAPAAEGAPAEETTEEAPAEAAEGEALAEAEAPAEGGQEEQKSEEAAGEPPADGEQPAAEGDQPPAEGEEPPAEGEQAQAEEETEATPEGEEGEAPAPAEGEEGQAPAEEAAEGGELPADGEQPPAQEGDAPAEEAAPAEGEEASKTPVPQSDTFEEGARAESPVAVGEKLSREGSPTADQVAVEGGERAASPPVPGTPDKDGSIIRGEEEDEEEEEEDEEDYEDDEPQYDREQLINRYHQALAERQQLQDQNYQLQHKLAEHFRKKKADERQDVDKNVTDQEQRYLKYMANLDELRRQNAEEAEMFKQQIEEMRERCEERREHVNDERLKFVEFKKQIALNAINSRSGKPIPPRDVEQHFINESRKEEEVVKVRLENIKLKNKLKKKELQLKSKEELAEGLHMIDFEQLKIENQTYNEKIEERNEELLKLRKKITSTVQVLTHLKEKLQFVQGENGGLNLKLKDVEELAARKRDILSRTKQARDALRIDNQRLRQNCGLLGNEPLLRDFEERKDESDDLKIKLDQLKMQHAELTLNLNGVRTKIEQAKQGRL